jgi:plasmid stabilization system protein ParE
MLNIIWTNDAADDVLENIEFLEKHWTKKEADRFSAEIDNVLDKLAIGNLTFKPSKYRNTYEVPILKQVTLFYQIHDDNIVLIHFWNNHKNRDNLVIK